MMIRKFAGSDGKLVELLKPELAIGTRRRAPKGILYRDDFYRVCGTDFDAEHLSSIEQRFAHVYEDVLAHNELDGHQGAALIDWIASMIVRTELPLQVLQVAGVGIPKLAPLLTDAWIRSLSNLARGNWHTMYQDLFTRTGWKWLWHKFPPDAGEIVLTDAPVFMTSSREPGGMAVVVPLSSSTVLYGGGTEALTRMHALSLRDLNFSLAGRACRHIFAGSTETLVQVAESLSDESTYDPQSVAAARKPFFGLPERIEERMAAGEVPDNFDFAGDLMRLHESCGRPSWEPHSPNE